MKLSTFQHYFSKIILITTLTLSLSLLSSCSKFINLIDDDTYHIINVKNESFSVIFSGNINGETHPCGCRHFPLGGLPGAAGILSNASKSKELLYLDAGDTFFPSSTLPPALKESLSFSAKNLAIGLAKLGLKYITPGDQDFAAGAPFLNTILLESGIKVLASNLKDPTSFPSEKWIKIQNKIHKIYITGVVDPSVLPPEPRALFTSISQGLDEVFKEIQSDGYDKDSPFHRLIIVSSSGMGPDKNLVKKYHTVDWVLGAHSQSFTTLPTEQGKTKLVQVLSRNHYLGEVLFSLSSDKKKDQYLIHEVREQSGKLLNPNPLYLFIDQHKKEMSIIQAAEQSKQESYGTDQNKIRTASSCLDCHEKQGTKWKSTPHSLAFITLANHKEEYNLKCIKCHSLGYQKKGGFNRAKDLVLASEEVNQEGFYKKYIQDLKKSFGKIQSVRQLSAKEIYQYSSKLLSIDDDRNVTHNFSGVQCLNCHNNHPGHPFEESEKTLPRAAKKELIKKNCLDCHSADQSPKWYEGNKLNLEKFNTHYLKSSCPKIEH